MALFYPRKQTVIISIVCLIVVVTAFIISNKPKIQDKFISNIAFVSSPSKPLADSITDTGNSDDWKKQFYGNSTTSLGFNKPNNSKTAAAAESLSLTDKFGRDFFAKFMLLQQNNLTDDEKSVKTIIDQSMNDLAASAPQPKIYFSKDIKIVSAAGQVAETKYANQVGSIFITKAPRRDSAIIAGQALDENNQKLISEITPIINSYTTLLNELKKVEVPQSLSEDHLDLVNAVSSMLYVSQGMSKVFTDPVTSLIALNSYSSAQDSLRSALLQIKKRISTNGGILTNQDPASFFLTIR